MNRCGFRRPDHGNRGGFDNHAGGQNFNPGHGAGSAGGNRGRFGSESGSFLGSNLQRGGEPNPSTCRQPLGSVHLPQQTCLFRRLPC